MVAVRKKMAVKREKKIQKRRRWWRWRQPIRGNRRRRKKRKKRIRERWKYLGSEVVHNAKDTWMVRIELAIVKFIIP